MAFTDVQGLSFCCSMGYKRLIFLFWKSQTLTCMINKVLRTSPNLLTFTRILVSVRLSFFSSKVTCSSYSKRTIKVCYCHSFISNFGKNYYGMNFQLVLNSQENSFGFFYVKACMVKANLAEVKQIFSIKFIKITIE